MNGLAVRILPYLLAFFSSLCIMILELVASRLVARHVGASLSVWTSVIGIMLGGICLGNVLGGKLADRVDPGKAIGPLYALGAFLTLACLWVNAVVGLTPGLERLSWDLRTLIVVTLDFLVPATVLGMIGPVVAKIAVTHARRAGSAIGDVYFMGAVGSIVGTFLAGFVLMYLVPISTIVTLVAAALAVLAAALIGSALGTAIGLAAAVLLAAGSFAPMLGMGRLPAIVLGSIAVNAVTLVGHGLTVLLAILGLIRLWSLAAAGPPVDDETVAAASKKPVLDEIEVVNADWSPSRPKLADLALLSFVASLGFMALEMVAGRLVTRHLGSSIYGWTSVIGVLLGGLSLGNFLGGKLADRIHREHQASWLFLVASMLTLSIIVMEKPPYFLERFLGDDTAILSHAITMTHLPRFEKIPLQWWARVLLVVTTVFLLPSIAMGTVSPLVAKLAVERVRKSSLTGRAIGQVYAWGMVGSILGTFLTGFVLIDVLGTKGVILIVGSVMALAATMLGSVWHAAWAGIPMGLCVIAFLPVPYFEKLGLNWGLREERGKPDTTDDAMAWVDESNYYYIKVSNEEDADGQKRTLVLDNLIHGYFILGHPERLDYDYEFIYALVTRRVAHAKAHELASEKEKAGKTNAEKPDNTTDGGEPDVKAPLKVAATVPLRTLFLGGGAYTFQRYIQHSYPGSAVDVAEIDPAVTRANHMALGLPKDTHIKTTWGDARQFVENQQGKAEYDLIYGDAFNDFSVPWHLTTREFNEKLSRLMSPKGVYMINIIDAYESDATAKEKTRTAIEAEKDPSPQVKERITAERLAHAHEIGGFLGAWVETAKLTFPHVAIFGTDDVPGKGLRETFVVVASKSPIEISDLGEREDDPQFFQDDRLFQPRPFDAEHLVQIKSRARGVVLTDDYAPVENLLAPVAATRGED